MLTLIARLGAVRVALAASAVREILRAVLIAPLPGAPSIVEGTIDVRGAVVPVIDLAGRLGLAGRPVLSPDEHLVVLEAGGHRVAVRVDEAEELLDVDERAIARSEGMIAAARTVAGVVRLEDGTVTMHDPAAFLTQAERDVLELALHPAPHPAPHPALPHEGGR